MMTITTVFCALLLLTARGDRLEDGLKSGKALLALYSEYNKEYDHKYSAKEEGSRIRLFRAELEQVVEANKQNDGWEAGLNFMSDMTEEEKAQYRGLNSSMLEAQREMDGTRPSASRVTAPAETNWRSKGAVGPVKNQGGCGSCWAFAAVATMEGVQQIKTGKLENLAEQELVDCVYRRQGGCRGGIPADGFKYAKENRRLAPTSSVQYRGRFSRSCNYRGKPSGLKARVTGSKWLGKREGDLINALADGPVSVCYHAGGSNQRYRRGELRDNSCPNEVNHGVTAVGYTRTGITLKNSWGTSWGDRGYITFKRGHHNCGLYLQNAAVNMSGGRQEELEELEE